MVTKTVKGTENPGSKPKTNTSVRAYGSDPLVVEKGRASKAFLDKYGFPKEIVKK